MFDTARSFLTSHRDAAKVVKRAQRFSVRLPLVGQVKVPPPDQLAFYGVLGALAGVGALEWPVAVAIGVGQAVMSRRLGDNAQTPPQSTASAATDAEPPRSAPARKAPARKTPAKKAVAKKSAAKETTP